MHIPGVIKIYSDYKARYIIHFKIYTIQSKTNIQILRSSHLTSGRKSSDFLAWTLSSLRQRSMKTVFFLLKICVSIGERRMITAYPSGYKVLPLQVTSDNKDVISFPHKHLIEINHFRTATE